jgi:hypothetical protein
MIRIRSEAAMNKVQKGAGFTGENGEVLRSGSLSCDIARLGKSLWADFIMDDT